jgi:hypothetical protein
MLNISMPLSAMLSLHVWVPSPKLKLGASPKPNDFCVPLFNYWILKHAFVIHVIHI